MADYMNFPKRWEDFLHDYEFEDSRRIYTNGSRLIPSFRVKQMMEHYFPADVEPVRHAHWNYRCPIDGNSYRYCSKCLSAVYDSVLYVSKNYCPNCGAKMDRSSNEE